MRQRAGFAAPGQTQALPPCKGVLWGGGGGGAQRAGWMQEDEWAEGSDHSSDSYSPAPRADHAHGGALAQRPPPRRPAPHCTAYRGCAGRLNRRLHPSPLGLTPFPGLVRRLLTYGIPCPTPPRGRGQKAPNDPPTQLHADWPAKPLHASELCSAGPPRASFLCSFMQYHRQGAGSISPCLACCSAHTTSPRAAPARHHHSTAHITLRGNA